MDTVKDDKKELRDNFQELKKIAASKLQSQHLEKSILPKRPRPTVQWKVPISQKSFIRSQSNHDISNMNQFDRNNLSQEVGRSNNLFDLVRY